MKIISLTAENVKRLKAVEIRPDGAMVVLGGKNGAGKSSILDAIEMALGGKDRAPAVPIRRGESEASVVLELDDLKVTRTFTASGNSYLRVENKDGARFQSPQAILDKLVGTLSFDPLEFSRMAPREQLATLKALVGLDFSELDRKRAEVFQARAETNRAARDLRGALSNMTFHSDTPIEEVSAKALMEELRAAREINQANQRQRTELEKRRQEVQAKQGRLAEIRNEIKALEQKIRDLQSLAGQIEADIEAGIDAGKRFAEQVEALRDVDLAAIEARIAEADEINAWVRENKAFADVDLKAEQTEAKAEALTREIEAIDQQKAEALAAAKFPIPGMSFDENGVLLNGLPFAQASSAEQLRASVAMGLALNPKLKVLLIRDGSLLDADSLRMVAEMAAAADGQCWVERVSEGDEVSVIIEDGTVKGAHLKEVANAVGQ
jgi:DNA repair exonuclease SbcCD ATPase subunit